MSRRVLITGVSGGIGVAIARRFSADGWEVIGTDQREVSSDVPLSRFALVDCGDHRAFAALASDVASEGLHALVHNAAVQHAGTIANTSLREWNATFAVNVTAAFVGIQEALPALSDSAGAIVLVGSVHSRATSPGRIAYVTSKGALTSLARAAALELAPLGIRVNVALPGAVDTPMLRRGLEHAGVVIDDLIETVPLRSIAAPSDVANVVSFLTSRDSSHITGQEIVVDGGATIMLATELRRGP